MFPNRVIFINNVIKILNPVGEPDSSIHHNAQFLFFITLVLMLFVIIDIWDLGAFCIQGKSANIDKSLCEVKVDSLEYGMVLADVLNDLV